ncbi:hypothetical protein B0H11DRAFT_2312758 [Mycena galericulata]|nr:hypothetical protein B0H11DRAFT_2312758 [Mycena galericulata]
MYFQSPEDPLPDPAILRFGFFRVASDSREERESSKRGGHSQGRKTTAKRREFLSRMRGSPRTQRKLEISSILALSRFDGLGTAQKDCSTGQVKPSLLQPRPYIPSPPPPFFRQTSPQREEPESDSALGTSSTDYTALPSKAMSAIRSNATTTQRTIPSKQRRSSRPPAEDAREGGADVLQKGFVLERDGMKSAKPILHNTLSMGESLNSFERFWADRRDWLKKKGYVPLCKALLWRASVGSAFQVTPLEFP